MRGVSSAPESWSYVDGTAPWLSLLTIDLAGTSKDETIGLAYDPAGEVVTRETSG